MNLVETIIDAIWEGFAAEDNACVDRQMDLIDTGGYYETFDMAKIAEHVLERLDDAQTIRTITQLDELPDYALVRTAAEELYERNPDGTWCIIGRPDGDISWSDRDVPSQYLLLPAHILWAPGI